MPWGTGKGDVKGMMAELKRQHQAPMNVLTPQKIEAVSKILAKRLIASTPYSRAYLKATLSEIHITDQMLKLSGTKKSMANLIANNGAIAAEGAVRRRST